MDILITRKWFTHQSTISEIQVSNEFVGFVLEDIDRGLDDSMPLPDLLARKVHGITAIPTGHYEMAINFSNKFNRLLPLLLNVKGFEGIRFHSGNVATDSDGCLLVGLTRDTDFVGQSRAAFSKWFPLIQKAIKTEKIFVTLQRDKEAWRQFVGTNPALATLL